MDRTRAEQAESKAGYGRRAILKALSVAGVATIGSSTVLAETATAKSARASETFPDLISLPEGFQPEGITTGRGTTFFVGSLASGDVYRGDLRTGGGEVFVEGEEDRVAIGLSHDRRGGNLFVAGGGTGEAYVYDDETGETVETYELTAPPGTFVNDVVVTSEAAYFTDSFQPFLYKLPLGPGGRLPDASDVEELELGDAFESVSGFNANGIDAAANTEYLLVINSTTGTLYRVDPASGEATAVDLGGDSLTNGDGILLDGKTLYVVRNQNNLIAEVKLDPGATSGEVVREITDPAFDVPTTVTEFGSSLYAVNARFGTNPEGAAYDVVSVSK